MYFVSLAFLALCLLVGASQLPFQLQPEPELPSAALVSGPKFQPLRPPAFPLAVRSPYLSTWLSTHIKQSLNGQWPIFWTGTELGWTGLLQVDNTTYEWLGYPSSQLPNIQSVDTISVEYTATKSVFTVHAGKQIGLNVTFLTPITLHDLRRQGIPASYISLSFWSLDKKEHDVKVYADVDGHWVSGDANANIQWSMSINARKSPDEKSVISHIIEKQNDIRFGEWSDHAEWGQLYWSTAMDQSVTYQVGVSDDVRTEFINEGKLADSIDADFRPISERLSVFAFSHDVGRVSKHNSSRDILFTIGYLQDPILQFASPSGIKQYSPLWKSYFPTPLEVIYFHFQDHSHSVNVSSKLDSKIQKDASKFCKNGNYGAILALSARQAVGAIVFAESASEHIINGEGSKPLVFLKEISSDGNMQTVDVIFPAMPIFLYLEPSILGLLLEPLFQHQEAGLYPNNYSIHDLGSSFPNATGHPDGNDEYMPVEECGNMIFMALAYSQFVSSTTTYLTKHYRILKQWTTYLIEFGLVPATQVSTDDFAGPLANQTNLALKAILGIKAMSFVAGVTGHKSDVKEFDKISEKYMRQWEKYAFVENGTHAKLAYQLNSSWGSLYNAYADDLLDLGLFPESIREAQDQWYYKKTERYGLPLDSRHMYTKSDWEMFIAAISSYDTRDLLIDRLARWLNETSTDRPFTDLYDTIGTGGYPGITFINRPVVGGHFALLALEKAKELRNGTKHPDKNDFWGFGWILD